MLLWNYDGTNAFSLILCWGWCLLYLHFEMVIILPLPPPPPVKRLFPVISKHLYFRKDYSACNTTFLDGDNFLYSILITYLVHVKIDRIIYMGISTNWYSICALCEIFFVLIDLEFWQMYNYWTSLCIFCGGVLSVIFS